LLGFLCCAFTLELVRSYGLANALFNLAYGFVGIPAALSVLPLMSIILSPGRA
jgi:hypothetical protein